MCIQVRSACKWLKLWSGLSESNRHLNLGKVPYYHYTKAARLQLLHFITRAAVCHKLPRYQASRTEVALFYETWLMRAAFTTGERRWRSAKREALSLSVYTRPNFSPSS